jgi:hypothetical protein
MFSSVPAIGFQRKLQKAPGKVSKQGVRKKQARDWQARDWDLFAALRSHL